MSKAELFTIYVYLLDEGVDVWRPVLAEKIGESTYRIIEQNYDQSIEIWEFGPGDIVYCEPTKLYDRVEIVELVAKHRILSRK